MMAWTKWFLVINVLLIPTLSIPPGPPHTRQHFGATTWPQACSIDLWKPLEAGSFSWLAHKPQQSLSSGADALGVFPKGRADHPQPPFQGWFQKGRPRGDAAASRPGLAGPRQGVQRVLLGPGIEWNWKLLVL